MSPLQSTALAHLDASGAPYEIVSLLRDGAHDTESILQSAHFEAIEPALYKTLVFKGNKTGVFVCLIPYSSQLQYKRAAQASGNRKCTMLAPEDLLETTGYVRGSCSPVGMKAVFPLIVDASVKKHKYIYINAGIPHTLVKISPQSLKKAKDYRIVDLLEGKD